MGNTHSEGSQRLNEAFYNSFDVIQSSQLKIFQLKIFQPYGGMKEYGIPSFCPLLLVSCSIKYIDTRHIVIK